MAVYLIESKADQQKLIDYVGEDTAKLFFTLKDRLKSPENDIYYWLKKDPQDLKDRLSELQNTQTHKQKEDDAREGAYLLYEDDNWKVYEIDTYPAAKKYGKNTKWCIAGSKYWNNGESGEEYFEDYHENNGINFYFYLNKKNPSEKYAFAHSMISEDSYQVFNAEDEDITFSDLSFLPQVDIGPGVIPYFPADGSIEYKGFEPPFRGNDRITHVEVITDQVKASAFENCTSLESVNLNGAYYIGDSAFAGCTSLREVTGTQFLEDLMEGAFADTDLRQFVFPKSLTSIKDYAFYGCKSLQQIDFRNNAMQAIGNFAFEDCTSLGWVTLSRNLVVFGEGMFKGCTNLQRVDYFGKYAILDEDLFKGCPSNLIVMTNNQKLIDYCKANNINVEITDG